MRSSPALARKCPAERIAFAVGAKRIAVAAAGRHRRGRLTAAIDIAVADYQPDWWPASTWLLIRSVKLDPAQVSADPRSRRRRTPEPGSAGTADSRLARADATYAYSFILTDLDMPSWANAAVGEHWYRHRRTVVNIFRDSKHGAAPSPVPVTPA